MYSTGNLVKVNNKLLLAEIAKCKENDFKLSDELTIMMISLVVRYSKKSNFAGYSYIDEMRSKAIMTLVEKWHKFNPEKSQNPFAYFTQISYSSFIYVLNAERKQRDIKDKAMVKLGLMPSDTFQLKYKDEMDIMIKKRKAKEENTKKKEQFVSDTLGI